MPSFADIHGKKPEDIKRPPPIPYGHYIAAVDGQPVKGETKEQKLEQWTIKGKLMQPQADVDADKLMAWKDQTGESVLGQHVYHRFNAAAIWRLTEFVTHVGLGDVAYPECMSQCPGRQYVVEIGHEPSQDGKSIVHTVRGTSALPK